MFSPRWRKLVRDLAGERGRLGLMTAAITVSLSAVGAVLGAFAVLEREIAVNYLGTNPASATLELTSDVDASLVAAVRKLPSIAEAEARETVLARARVGEDWRPLLLFVVEDFEDLRLNTFRHQAGAWPPPEGTIVIERTAVSMLEVDLGERLAVRAPHGQLREVAVVGLVHDPGLAPAWQERMGYAYASRATLAWLGEEPALHELRVAVRDSPFDRAAVAATAGQLAAWLGEQGRTVRAIRVPPPGQHPHQVQMTTVLLMFVVFSGFALFLGGILVATSLAAMLSRQVREIGVMKTLGARTLQIAGLYVVLVTGIGAISFLLAWPLGSLGARALSASVAGLLNLELTRSSAPGWVSAIQAVAGILVPLGLAAIPILGASRTTVRRAIDQHGAGAGGSGRTRTSALPIALRNALRRPVRLALTVALLAAGGAMFMTAQNVLRGWERNLEKFYEARFYDLEIRFHSPLGPPLLERLRGLPGVRLVEGWGYGPAEISNGGGPEISATYPDGRHSSFTLLGPPPDTSLIRFPVLRGRWLRPEDLDAVVLNHSAAARFPGVEMGAPVALTVGGRGATWKLVGIVEEIGSPAAAYVSSASFASRLGGADGGRLVRLVTTARSASERAAILRSVEREIEAAGVSIEQGLPLAEHRTAVGDHIVILINALLAMAMVMAIVGTLGLISTLGTNVLERARELGIMKTLGATSGRLRWLLVQEALAIGAASWLLALGLALPLTAMVGRLVGGLGFLAPLPLVFAATPALLWLALTLLASLIATLAPAYRIARLTVREALGRV